MTNRFSNMFDDVSNNQREDEYCDKCELCIRNSLIPSRGQGLEGSGTILHLVAAPSPADRKTKYVLSGNTGKFIRRILEDKKLLALPLGSTSIPSPPLGKALPPLTIK